MIVTNSFGTWNYIFQTLLVVTLMVLKTAHVRRSFTLHRCIRSAR